MLLLDFPNARQRYSANISRLQIVGAACACDPAPETSDVSDILAGMEILSVACRFPLYAKAIRSDGIHTLVQATYTCSSGDAAESGRFPKQYKPNM